MSSTAGPAFNTGPALNTDPAFNTGETFNTGEAFNTGPATPLENQRAASDPLASVWVNASAGSGKTTVLTARVTRLLLAGTPPEKILCLTYTRAGAAEMTNRITEKFSGWVSCDDDTLNADLKKLQDMEPTDQQRRDARRLFARVLACPGGLRIRTIHSFCQEILSRFPIEAGLPPHFGLIEGQDLDELKNDQVDALLREAAQHPDSDTAQALSVLIADQGEYGFERMLQGVLRESGRIEEEPAALMARLRRALDLAPDDNADRFRLQAMRQIPTEALRQMAGWLLHDSPTQQKRGRLLNELLDLAPEQRALRFKNYYRLFLKEDLQPFADKSVANKKIRDAHPAIVEIAGREAQRLRSTLERIEAVEIATLTASMLIVGDDLAKRVAAAKAARAVLDYDDLILRTEQLLTRSGISAWILYKLDNGIDHILVDEAQDTSRSQWRIVQALTEEFYAGRGVGEDRDRTLFVVGDEKQSIFSFQNADPDGFLFLRQFFEQRLADAGKKLARVPLHISFRSAPAILKAVDAVFEPDPVRDGVSQEPVRHAAHPNPDGSLKCGRVEVWPLCRSAKEEEDGDGTWIMPVEHEDEHDPQVELAQQIAQKIKGWLIRKEYLPGSRTPIRAGDVMILLRRRGRFADLMVRALKSHGVPVTGIDRMHLISQLPVMDLLALIRFVLLPEDDLNLAALLRSPLLGLSEEGLMNLAMGRRENLWACLKKSPAFESIASYLSARLNEADFSSPFDFLARTLSLPCPANCLSGRQALWARLGEESLDPMEELLNAAQSFGHSHPPSLQNFLHWLTKADSEIKRELDRGDPNGQGQVRIMTVHASKGLEAPIVFLPDTASVPRSADLPKFQWMDVGEDSKPTPLFLSRAPDFGVAERIWRKARDKQMQEYRRLLYVALTRAASHLYICGWQSKKDAEGNWYDLVSSALRPLHQPEANQSHSIAEIVLADPVLNVAAAEIATQITPPDQALPEWAFRPVPPPINAQPPRSALALSSNDETSAASPDAAFARGRIIHRLLQSLPDIDLSQRVAATQRFLAQPRHRLNDAQRSEIAQEVHALLQNQNFAALFARDGRAEVGLTGTLDGVTAFRQIDRLCLRDNEVWIVDYKTNRPPPTDPRDIPDAYRLQLNEYRTLLRGIYPDRPVRCFLLWTYAPRLMEII